MYVGSDFPPMSTYDERVLTFNYVDDIDQDEIIMSSVWTVELHPDMDPSADQLLGSRVMGVPSIDGMNVSQTIGTLQPGVIYRIRCVATTNMQPAVELYAHVKCLSLG